MSDRTKIEWTDATWNPIKGCTRVSEGCRFCYAEGLAARFHKPGQWGEGLTQDGRWTGKITLDENALTQPLRWKRPRHIFVNSLSDLFHPAAPDAWIDRIFAVMALCPQHTFQVLTKRPERMREYCKTLGGHHERDRVSLAAKAMDSENGFWWTLGPSGAHLPNVWLGVSVENQTAADERIPYLLGTPAAVRFVLCEPMLGKINLLDINPKSQYWRDADHFNPLTGKAEFDSDETGSGVVIDRSGPRLNWVICGGEIGPHARDNDFTANARSLLAQCRDAGVPFFGKQNVKKTSLPDDLMVREFPQGTTLDGRPGC